MSEDERLGEEIWRAYCIESGTPENGLVAWDDMHPLSRAWWVRVATRVRERMS